jgi:tripartite-type tricarboxylate transporter receptor subunit TctC
MAGIDMVHVPYKGGGPAMTALMGGQVQVYFAAMPSAFALVKQGKLKAIAVTSAKRSSALPELPTIAESGLPGYDETTWNGLLAPAKTPRPIIEKLKHEAHAVLKMAATRERFAADGAEASEMEPDAFAAMIRREVVKWAKVIRAAGIKPE